jgi:glycosyltransferase involved in cell wall biosynthesis
MTEPLVSVIVPCFNAEAFMRQTLQSVCGQTYRNLEILVVDDGSTDHTPDIAREFAAADARVRLLQKTNGGLSSARNFGIDHARGKYLSFVDGDDFWHPSKIEKHVAHLEANPEVGVSYSATQFVDQRGQPMRHRRFPKMRNLSDYYLFCRNPITTGSTAVFRREIFDHHRFDETLAGYEDVDCWLRIAFAPPKKWRFEGVNELLTYYRVHPQGISNKADEQFASAQRALAATFSYAPAQAAKYARLAEAFQLRFYARRAVVSRQSHVARRFIFRAIKTDPRILFVEGAKTLVTLVASFLPGRRPAR